MGFRRRCGFESLESRWMLTAVDIPDDLTGQVQELVSTPVNIDSAAGIRAAEIRVSYDTTLLDIDESDIQAGSVWAGDASVDLVADVDDAAGTIIVSIFAAESLPATGGSLIEFQFTIASGATAGDSAVIDLAEVRLNEGTIVLDTAPQPGADDTDGLITVVEATGTVTVSGTVYADVNNNSQPDSTEGLAGVTVRLINTTTGAVLAATTLSDGSYEFTNVAAGSYRIEEQQPAAYLEGGVNQIPVTIAAGQDLTGQDFRERGLRPEFIYNRLSTTLVQPIGSANWVSAINQIQSDAENGLVNAQQFVAQTTSLSEGAPGSQGAAEPAVVQDAAEGEAAATTAHVSQPTQMVMAEGERSTEAGGSNSVFDGLTMEERAPLVAAAFAAPARNNASGPAEETDPVPRESEASEPTLAGVEIADSASTLASDGDIGQLDERETCSEHCSDPADDTLAAWQSLLESEG